MDAAAGIRIADALRRAAWDIVMAGGDQTTGESARRGTNIWPGTGGGWMNGRGDDTTTMLEGYAHMVDFYQLRVVKNQPPRRNWSMEAITVSPDPGRTYAICSRRHRDRATRARQLRGCLVGSSDPGEHRPPHRCSCRRSVDLPLTARTWRPGPPAAKDVDLKEMRFTSIGTDQNRGRGQRGVRTGLEPPVGAVGLRNDRPIVRMIHADLVLVLRLDAKEVAAWRLGWPSRRRRFLLSVVANSRYVI